MFKAIWSTLRVDPANAAFLESSSGLARAYWAFHHASGKPANWRFRWFFARIVAFVRQIIRVGRFSGTTPDCDSAAVLFVSGTKNNELALQNVEAALKSKDVRVQHWKLPDLQSFYPRAYLLAAAFLPALLFRWLTARGYVRKSYRWAGDIFWFVYGYHLAIYLELNRHRPRALVVANDHSYWARTIVLAAKRLGIPTFYVQHASVTEHFPPLIFDYSLLEGCDAAQKYAQAGPMEGRAFLIGMPKSDRYAGLVRDSGPIECLGLCLNSHDKMRRVEALVAAVRQAVPEVSVCIRPHPAASEKVWDEWRQLADRWVLDISNGRVEGPFDFLGRVDAVAAGDSSIHLEAALLNVTPIFYDFAGDGGADWYGYCRNNLCECFVEPAEFVDYLQAIRQSRPSIALQARRYCVTIGTEFHGCSGELGGAIIEQVVSGQEVDLSTWNETQYENGPMVYEPK